MLNSDDQFKILKEALASDYEGSIGDLIKQQETQVAQTPEEQAQGLRGQPPGSSMAFPNSSGNFNTMGMSEPIDIKKVNNQGDVVRSYQSVPPGVGNLPMGDDVGTVIETPGTYQKGGLRDRRMYDLHQSLVKKKQEGGIRKYQNAGFNFGGSNDYSTPKTSTIVKPKGKYSKSFDYSEEGIKARAENSPYKNLSISEKIDLGLTTAGMVPGLGIIPDAINTVSNLGQGAYHSLTGDKEQAATDYKNAAWAAGGMIPAGGQAISTTKLGFS